jgi:transglutaminase-like putative cysteine protease
MPTGPAIRLRYSVDLRYEVARAGADFIFNIQAAQTSQQHVESEALAVSQPVPLDQFLAADASTRMLRLRAQQGPLIVSHTATVSIHGYEEVPDKIGETWIPDLPASVLPFLYPSRYCESDKLNALAMQHFGGLWQGYSRAQAICDWVQRQVVFASGSSLGTTSAVDTLQQGAGVCRDFAHLMIALCRAVNMPARFATGLDYGADPALGPTDFHAYVEVFLGGRWYIFDPSGTAIPSGFLRLASGRDASDCAYASIFGDVHSLSRTLCIEAVEGIDGIVRMPQRSSLALSTDAS